MTSWDYPPRQVTLLLCDGSGTVFGTLPPYDVPMPWWPEAEPVVAGACEHFGVDVTVLRLIASTPVERAAGGPVTYLAEVAARPEVDLEPWPSDAPDPLADEPLRLPYAKPGGPAHDLAWADEQLTAAGRPRSGAAVQVKSWNLSSVWRLPTADGPAWLKVVPPFFGHEGAMIRRLDPDVVPPLIATEGHRVLLADVPGEDHWDAPLPVLLRVLGLLVGLQREWVDRVGELEQVGAPDWRPPVFVPAVTELVSRTAIDLDSATVATLRDLVAGLPERFAEVAECGVPDTLVHGDFHPGNTRGQPGPEGRSVILDWGDCGIGNPLLDQAAFLASIAAEKRDPIRTAWAQLWRDAAPGSDPDHAARLLEPVAALRQAHIYRTFLDGIEPDERVYHVNDPAHWLRRAAALT
jgi:hypothetical protein